MEPLHLKDCSLNCMLCSLFDLSPSLIHEDIVANSVSEQNYTLLVCDALAQSDFWFLCWKVSVSKFAVVRVVDIHCRIYGIGWSVDLSY